MVVYKNRKAFSFVEVIITISIIALLAVVGFTVSNNYQDKTNNSKITADIETITNSLESYKQETKTLPLPTWNNNYFKEDASYAHSSSSDIFWVHGFITEWTLPKRYLDALPLDPKTNQYYAYGKLIANEEYELAGINWVNWEAESFVRWNYAAEVWPYNLIREYNGPDFVYDGSESNFPYNPDERILVAKINDFDGTVTINENITDTWAILSYTLGEWDKITVLSGWYAEIYFSDWTSSILWDTANNSELILSKMVFKKENNLFTDIKLTLGWWTIWNKATSLDDDSDFEIYTTDATAAVRWTIFWIKKDIDTNITVKEWKVNVLSISGLTDYKVLSQTLNKSTPSISTAPITWLPSVISSDLNGTTYIEVITGNPEKWTDIGYGWSTNISTSALNSLPPQIKGEALNNYWKITNTIQTQLATFSYINNNNYQIDIKLNDTLKNNAEFIKINGQLLSNNWESDTQLTLTQDTTMDSQEPLNTYTSADSELKVAFWYTKADGTEIYSQTLIIPLIAADYDDTSLNTPCDTFTVGTSEECAETDTMLTVDWWELVAYAPYNEAWDFDMYTNSWIISSDSAGVNIDDWWVLIDGSDYLKYLWAGLDLGDDDDYVIEMSVEKNALEQTWWRYIFDNEINKWLSIWKAWLQHTIKYKGNIICYDGGTTPCNLIFLSNFETIIINNKSKTLHIWTRLFPIDSIDANDLYIWSKNNLTWQLNWVVNYLKIYNQ